MTLSFSTPDKNRPWLTEISFLDFEVSWAGAGPERTDFCFASEDGRYVILANGANRASRIEMPITSGCTLGDVTNGMAFLSSYIAVSSRSSITFWNAPSLLNPSHTLTRVAVGAHDVITTATGQFVSPIGRSGLLIAAPRADMVETVTVMAAQGDFYFYRVANAGEMLACAVRSKGILACTMGGVQKQTKSITLGNADIVDVCAIATSTGLPFIAAGLDGTLVFFRDLLQDENPIAFAYEIEGSVYRVLSTPEHVFLLTSAGLYAIDGLSRRFLRGQPIEKMRMPMRVAHIDAVDVNLVADKWLLVVMPNNKVLEIDIDSMFAESSAAPDLIKWDEISTHAADMPNVQTHARIEPMQLIGPP